MRQDCQMKWYWKKFRRCN